MPEVKETVFVDRFEYEDISSLLNEILRKAEIFVRFNDCSPKYVKMTPKQYYGILNHNESLVRKVEKDYYILCMKIIF